MSEKENLFVYYFDLALKGFISNAVLDPDVLDSEFKNMVNGAEIIAEKAVKMRIKHTGT